MCIVSVLEDLWPHGMRAAQVVMDTKLSPPLPEAELPAGAPDVLQLPQHLLQGQQQRQDHQEDTPPVLRQTNVEQISSGIQKTDKRKCELMFVSIH